MFDSTEYEADTQSAQPTRRIRSALRAIRIRQGNLRRQFHYFVRWVRFGRLTERVVDTVANVVAEVEYVGRGGKVVGYWSYGHFHPDYPYRGEGIKTNGGYDER